MGRRRKSADNPATAERLRLIETVVSEHETGLLRYATRLLRDPAAAEDVVQNTFIKLAAAWRNGSRPSARLRAWLYQVTHNGAVDHIRRESRLRLLHRRHADSREHSRRGVSAEARRLDRLDTVMAHLGRLAPVERQVLLLRLEAGLSYNEIAAVTGRTRGNVGCILHHAVRKLARRFDAGAGAERAIP